MFDAGFALPSPPDEAPPTRRNATPAVEAEVLLAAAARLPVPRLLVHAGPRAVEGFLEFFTVSIPNPNTRRAYHRACSRFLAWCERGLVDLELIRPLHVAAYMKGFAGRPTTAKQTLAAIRMLLGWLVERHVLEVNPAREVRTERLVRQEGRTPAFAPGDVRRLLEATAADASPIGLRDHALLSTLAYTVARVSAALSLRVRDYVRRVGKHRPFLFLREKGGRQTEIPVHHLLEESLERYLEALDLARGPENPLFPAASGPLHRFGNRPLSRSEAHVALQRRLKRAGIEGVYSCHSFRATGITTFLESGGSLEDAQRMAGHADSRTTKLYDRRNRRIRTEDVERLHY